jgi:hypothetical protein
LPRQGSAESFDPARVESRFIHKLIQLTLTGLAHASIYPALFCQFPTLLQVFFPFLTGCSNRQTLAGRRFEGQMLRAVGRFRFDEHYCPSNDLAQPRGKGMPIG